MKNRKKKWLGFALVLTIIAVGAASLTAFGADRQEAIDESQMQKKQTICTVNQGCFKRGIHHTRQNTATNLAATSTANTSAAPTSASCQYTDCDGTHANHENHNYSYENYDQNHHGSSHGGGHHSGWHE